MVGAALGRLKQREPGDAAPGQQDQAKEHNRQRWPAAHRSAILTSRPAANAQCDWPVLRSLSRMADTADSDLVDALLAGDAAERERLVRDADTARARAGCVGPRAPP